MTTAVAEMDAPSHTILLVDDDAINLGVVVESLESRGYEVVVAVDGEEALQRAERVRPDLVLLDIMMPGMDGFEVCRRLKDNPATEDIPVIFMTSLGGTQDKLSGFCLGAVDYITKPVQVDEMAARVGLHLRLRALQRQLEVKNEELQREIAERKEMEASMRKREEELRALSENSPDPVVRYDRACRRIYANPAVERISGVPMSDLLGRTAEETVIFPDDENAKVAQCLKRVLETGQPENIELKFVRNDGAAIYFHTRYIPEFGSDGTVESVLAIARDITARKQHESVLLQQFELERRLSRLAANIPGFIYTFRQWPDGRCSFPFASAGIRDLFGLRPEDVAEDWGPLYNRAYPDDRSNAEAAIAISARKLSPFFFEFRAHHPEKGKIWAEARSMPERMPDGGVLWHGLMTDITERKEMEALLAKREREFRSLAESAPDNILRYDRECRVLYLNPQMEKSLGLPAERMLGRTHAEAFPDGTFDDYEAHLRKVIACGHADSFEVTLPDAGDGIRVHHLRIVAERDERGEVCGALAMGRDITGLKQTLEELARGKEALAEAQRIGQMGSWELDIREDQLSWSEEIFRIFEIDPACFGASYEAFLKTVHPDDRQRVNTAYRESVKKRVPYDVEHRLLFADGRIKHVRERCETCYDQEGKPLRSRGTVQDITKRKAMEEARDAALVEAERLVRVRSAFLAQMSHELRTPLNAILGYAQMLPREGEMNEKQLEGVGIIRESGDHLLALIDDILDLAKIEADRLELGCDDIPLTDFLGTAVDIVRVKAEEKNLGFLYEVDASLPGVIRGDAQRLRQILFNLLGNAVKYTESGQVSLRVVLATPSRLRFEVRDSGIGISEAQLETIFHPFEQACEARRRPGGTGLGLAISRHLARLMGGDITVESRLGEGSLFIFEAEVGVEGAEPARAGALMQAEEYRPPEVGTQVATPSAAELRSLRELALMGNMRSIVERATRLAEFDGRHRPFADHLIRLAKAYQSRSVLSFVDQCLEREEAQ